MSSLNNIINKSGRHKKQAGLLLAAALLIQGCAGVGKTDKNNPAKNPKTESSMSQSNLAESNRSQQESNPSAGQNAKISENGSMQQLEMYAMDTYMQLYAYGDQSVEALQEAKNEIERLDALLAAQKSGSELAKINEAGGGKVSEDTAYLIEQSKKLHEETGGKFEIAIYPVQQLWGFSTKQYRVPSESEIQEKLPLADTDAIRIDTDTRNVTFEKKGMEIELGAIAKGYTSAKVMQIFEKYGVNGMVNLGGNVQAHGKKPDGSLWRIGIRVPKFGQENSYVGILETENDAVITSGSSERFFVENNITYHHILDPATGYPANSGLLSATIIEKDGTRADGLSTSMFIFGKDKAIEFWRAHADEFQMILIDDNDQIYATEGLKGNFESDHKIEWIAKAP